MILLLTISLMCDIIKGVLQELAGIHFMRFLQKLQKVLKTPIFGVFFGLLLTLTPLASTPAYAEPTEITEKVELTEVEKADTSTTTTTETPTTQQTESKESSEETENACQDQLGVLSWLVCPSTGVLAKAVDAIYEVIESFLVVKPITSDSKSPIYIVWQYARDITNIVFVIMMLVVVLSQLTGLGLSNYGVKKALPRLIVVAIVVNLSFILCSLAVDVSNILGASLKNFFANIADSTIANSNPSLAAELTWSNLVGVLVGGGVITGLAISLSGGLGALIWMLIPALIGGILAVIVALITITMRQALISLLVMVSPLAFVAYLLPNTEKWFRKWWNIFFSMLVFFPAFSLLFGAAQLAGWVIIASATSAFGIILGMAVQVVPLFLCLSLLKMSGTALGAISNRLSALTNHANSSVKNWAMSNREQKRQKYLATSHMPAARLRRYLDYRNELRQADTANAIEHRKNLAEIRTQQKIRGTGRYTMTGDVKQDGKALRANTYTRMAKRAKLSSMDAITATNDTQHVLGNYGDYLGKTRTDRRLSAKGALGYKEYTRSAITIANDDEADTDYLYGEYERIAKKGPDDKEYKRFISSAAGGLGPKGEESVLAQVIAKAAANEARHRRDLAILQNKYKYSKSDARNMIVGYYVDDSGLAVDKSGKSLGETSPGEFLSKSPEKLIPYDKTVNGIPYFEMTDQNGNYITRIFKNDSAAMKEILSNFDMPINDPINGLYGILASIEDGDANLKARTNNALDHVGLAKFSTTIGRAILSANFKEKAAFAGPMYATSVMNRYIKDYVHQNLARLDNINKTAKPGVFNTQDAAELGQLAMLMNPNNWANLFPEDSLRTYRNVNGELMKGSILKYNDDGSLATKPDGNFDVASVPAEQATYEQLMNTVLTKFLYPAGPKFASMMSRFTSNTADNQKPGTASGWKNLYEAMKSWNGEDAQTQYPGIINPLAKQENSTVAQAREINYAINPLIKQQSSSEANSNSAMNQARKINHAINPLTKQQSSSETNSDSTINQAREINYVINPPAKQPQSAYNNPNNPALSSNIINSHDNPYNNILADLQNLQFSTTSAEEFAEEALKLLSYQQFAGVAEEFNQYIQINPHESASSLMAYLEEILLPFLQD